MTTTRKLAAIMFTDIVGYTGLMGSDEDRAFEVLRKNREIHANLIEKYIGTLIKEMGDGMLISFNLASDAVRCAIKIQKACKKEGIPLKIGIHEGEMVFEGSDVLGDGVNIASRIQDHTDEGCITISGSVYRDIKNKSGIKAEFIGEKSFKNVEEPVKIYKVCCEDFVEEEMIEVSPVKEDKKSIAVLPFVNMSNDPDQEYFCDGLSEELLNGLAQLDNLKVAARTSSFYFKGQDVDIVEIGQKLRVNTVLEGSVRKSGNRLRITAQLINIADGFHLWSERYDRQMDDIFDIQDEISLSILDTLKVKLFGDKQANLIKRSTENQEAYELYLNGRFHRNKIAPEPLFKAIEYFNKAIEIEPEYAEAYAGLAVTYFYLLIYNILPPDGCEPQLTETAQKALELDNTIAEGHLAKGVLNFWNRWDFKEAESAFRKSVELNPNHGEAHGLFSMILGIMGKYAEAIKHAKKAYELDPFSVSTNYYIGWAYFLTSDFDLMARQGKRMIELDPPYLGHAFLGFEHWVAGRFKEAVIELELATGQKMPVTYAWLACVNGILGEKEKAKDILNKLLELGKNQYIGAYNIGLIYLGMGENDLAFEWFNKGCDEQHDGILFFLKQKFKVLQGLKKDARMDELIAKFGLPGN